MDMTAFLATPLGIAIFLILTAWEVAWKGVAMWKSARHSQKAWFVSILIFNTIGILPILYIAFFQKKGKR
jgi:hypothetical protein